MSGGDVTLGYMQRFGFMRASAAAKSVSQLSNDSGFITMADLSGCLSVTDAQDIYVPKTYKINSHPLISDIILTPSDIGSPSGSGSSTGANTGDQDLSAYAVASAVNAALATKQGSIATGSISQYLRGDLSLATFPSIPAAQINSDWNAVSGVAQISNKPAIPSVTRTTSALTLSLVGTGATGTQISAANDSTIRVNVSCSTTATIAGPSTSLVTLKKCATNSATEGSWTSVAIFENDQTVTLAVVLQSVQVTKGQLETDVPAGWFVKLVNSGTGTHSETFISGEKTIYG